MNEGGGGSSDATGSTGSTEEMPSSSSSNEDASYCQAGDSGCLSSIESFHSSRADGAKCSSLASMRRLTLSFTSQSALGADSVCTSRAAAASSLSPRCGAKSASPSGQDRL